MRMKNLNIIRHTFALITVLLLAATFTSCGTDNEPDEYIPPHNSINTADASVFYKTHPKQIEFDGVNPEGLKILAIGNSFTYNGTHYMPWIIDRLGLDGDVFIAKLYQGGATLKMHWENHVADREDYVMHYSHGGKWNEVSIKTVDEALQVFDWDIVVMQQMSVHAGLDYTYQPYLDNLKALVRDTNSNPVLAWQYTWAFTSAANHAEFTRYFKNDPDAMYEAVISTCEKMTYDFDLRIPSGQLIRKLREAYPEQEDGFSYDGVHLSEPGCFALSLLWHEVLIAPRYKVSSLDLQENPSGISADFSEKSKELIKKQLQEFDVNDVPMIH